MRKQYDYVHTACVCVCARARVSGVLGLPTELILQSPLVQKAINHCPYAISTFSRSLPSFHCLSLSAPTNNFLLSGNHKLFAPTLHSSKYRLSTWPVCSFLCFTFYWIIVSFLYRTEMIYHGPDIVNYRVIREKFIDF